MHKIIRKKREKKTPCNFTFLEITTIDILTANFQIL